MYNGTVPHSQALTRTYRDRVQRWKLRGYEGSAGKIDSRRPRTLQLSQNKLSGVLRDTNCVGNVMHLQGELRIIASSLGCSWTGRSSYWEFSDVDTSKVIA
jgi:hypothetical protein